MKQTNFFKKTLLLLALLAGVSTAWADPKTTFSIPQDLGNYILVGQDKKGASGLTADGVTLTGCKVDDGGTCYAIGSTGSSTVIQFKFTAEIGSYVFSFKSGTKVDNTSTLALTLKKGEGAAASIGSATINSTGSWTPVTPHNYLINIDDDEATYTLTMTMSLTGTGSNGGNFDSFCFHTADQLKQHFESTSTYLDLSYNSILNNAKLASKFEANYISRDGGYISDIISYVKTAGRYRLSFSISAYKQSSKLKITVKTFDGLTTEIDQQSIDITAAGNYSVLLNNNLTIGFKKIKFDFLDDDDSGDSYLYNLSNVNFATDEMPLISTTTTYLDFGKGSISTTGSPRYSGEGNHDMTYIADGGVADNYYVLNSEDNAYYNVQFAISNANSGKGYVKLTIMDLVSSSIEINNQSIEIEGNGTYNFKLGSKLSKGIKKVRLDFDKGTITTSYLFNLSNLTFYKRSLNEGYNYTPVAATGVDVVLTRTINAGNWSTLCLPFNMTTEQVTATFGEGTKLATIGSYNSSTKVLAMNEAFTISANVPCMIKVPSNFTSGTISGVTVATGTPEVTISGDFKFVGTYCKIENLASGNYYVKNNNLYQATGSQSVKPFRAYFTSVPTEARLLFFDDDETTGINKATLLNNNEEIINNNIFDLQGRRVVQPTKGLYIVNGKKVIIK